MFVLKMISFSQLLLVLIFIFVLFGDFSIIKRALEKLSQKGEKNKKSFSKKEKKSNK